MVPAGSKAKCLLSVNHTIKTIYQNKAFHNFHKRGQCLAAGCIKSLNKGLVCVISDTFSKSLIDISL